MQALRNVPAAFHQPLIGGAGTSMGIEAGGCGAGHGHPEGINTLDLGREYG